MTPEPSGHAPASPLSLAELAELEATLLPALERHHLRLLAHGLRTLQAVSPQPISQKPISQQPVCLPDRAAISAWVRQQAPIADDEAFQATLVEQLVATGVQLQRIADELDRDPLALDLVDLRAWTTRQADRRLGQADTHQA